MGFSFFLRFISFLICNCSAPTGRTVKARCIAPGDGQFSGKPQRGAINKLIAPFQGFWFFLHAFPVRCTELFYFAPLGPQQLRL